MLALLQVHMLHVDAAVGPVSVMFSGAREPIAAAGQTAVFGKLAVARQVTAPAETYRRRLNVGRCRDVEIEVHSLYMNGASCSRAPWADRQDLKLHHPVL